MPACPQCRDWAGCPLKMNKKAGTKGTYFCPKCGMEYTASWALNAWHQGG